MATPEIRVHKDLGVLVRFEGEDTWVWIHPSGPQQRRMTDPFAERPGWTEIPMPPATN